MSKRFYIIMGALHLSIFVGVTIMTFNIVAAYFATAGSIIGSSCGMAYGTYRQRGKQLG